MSVGFCLQNKPMDMQILQHVMVWKWTIRWWGLSVVLIIVCAVLGDIRSWQRLGNDYIEVFHAAEKLSDFNTVHLQYLKSLLLFLAIAWLYSIVSHCKCSALEPTFWDYWVVACTIPKPKLIRGDIFLNKVS